jgi:hypothetical protein
VQCNSRKCMVRSANTERSPSTVCVLKGASRYCEAHRGVSREDFAFCTGYGR